MTLDPRVFWSIAKDFPPNKEDVYPAHAEAQEFAKNCGKTVLEYGCGGGSDTFSYLRRGCQVYYADIVPANLMTVQRRVVAAGYTGKALPIMLKSSTDLGGVHDGALDVVNCHGVLHHIADRMQRYGVLREFHRVLRPGGRLYLMLYTEHLHERFEPQIAKLVEAKGISEEEAFGWCTDGEGCPYAIAYDEMAGRELIEDAGFGIESIYEYNNLDFRTFRCVV